MQLCPCGNKNSFKFWWGIKAGLNGRHGTLTKIINSTSYFYTFESPWEKWSVFTRMNYWLREDKRGLHLPMMNSKNHKKTSFVFKNKSSYLYTTHFIIRHKFMMSLKKKKRYSVLFFSNILAVAYFSKILCSRTVYLSLRNLILRVHINSIYYVQSSKDFTHINLIILINIKNSKYYSYPH